MTTFERPSTEQLSRAISTRDHLRRSPAAYGAAPGYKEWYHFAIRGNGIDFLLNFSLVDDVRPFARKGSELSRITCLVKTDQGWDGDVEERPIEELEAQGGLVSLLFGSDGVWFDGEKYHLRTRLLKRPIEIEATLLPLAFPSEANNVLVDDGPCINWMVLPRLVASGTVTVAGRSYSLEGCPAYHDHNWGSFRWGRNFAWEWGYALPELEDDPFNVVLVRLCDRGHNTDLMQGLFIWKHGRQVRVFRDAEIKVHHEGLLRARAPFKLPRVMGLVAPGRVTDVPKRYILEAKGRGDWARFEFVSDDMAQVVIPNDDDLGVTIINEVFGKLRFSGEVSGESFDNQGASVCEFLGA